MPFFWCIQEEMSKEPGKAVLAKAQHIFSEMFSLCFHKGGKCTGFEHTIPPQKFFLLGVAGCLPPGHKERIFATGGKVAPECGIAIQGMAVAADVLTLVLGGLGLVLLILCAGSDCWRQDAKDPLSSVGLSVRCRGLWSECIFDNVADLWTCDIPVSYLGEHPAVLVVTRGLVILSGFMTLSAVPLFVAGMNCTNLCHDKVPQKYKFSFAAGSLFLLGGLSGAVAVLWYGIDTVQKYKLEVSLGIPGVTYELGYSYWMAAVGVACATASGILSIASNSCQAKSSQKEQRSLGCHPSSARGQRTYL
ncbi:claudin-16-like [Sceloporus undulatus]|uniref:claudin-16-like n=1 Tax=Sceloporus undulatus TaxID=8520 RepID=UPI001C4DAC1E|nr:claudin-16-like [Sceloporus undulatus]